MTDRPDAPGPLNRRGPRPLLLHLLMAMTAPSSPGCAPAWPNWNPASPSWNAPGPPDPADPPPPGAAPPEPPPPEPPPPELPAGLDPALLAGIAAYRRHPYHRDLPDPPALWQEGSARLLDYGADLPAGAPTLLVVPSLINRAYVLDLAPGRSGMRYLAGQGVRPLLLDWGWPDAAERRFTLTDLVAGRLERALLAAVAATGAKVALAGYCMGGLLAVAAAGRRGDLVGALALLAVPWDFHAGLSAEQRALLPQLRAMVAGACALTGALPVDLLQYLFAMQDPAAIAAKFRGFGAMAQNSARARQFVALEDWLNDGVPLPAPIAEEVFAGWYEANSPAAGTWRIAGLPVDPARLAMPCLVAVPAADRIVPPASALALATLIAHAHVLRPGAGHIGMATGARAGSHLWRPLAEWLRTVWPAG